MAESPPPPEACANCGASIPPKAHACPSCGADERTGWRESSVYDGLDLPDDDQATSGGPIAREPQRPRNPAIGRILFVLFLVVLVALFLLGG